MRNVSSISLLSLPPSLVTAVAELLTEFSGAVFPVLSLRIWSASRGSSRCRSLWKLWQERRSRLRWRAAIPLTMWRPKSKIRKVCFQQFLCFFLFFFSCLIAVFCVQRYRKRAAFGVCKVLVSFSTTLCRCISFLSVLSSGLIVDLSSFMFFSCYLQESPLTSNVSSLRASSSRMDALWPTTTSRKVSLPWWIRGFNILIVVGLSNRGLQCWHALRKELNIIFKSPLIPKIKKCFCCQFPAILIWNWD